MQLGAQTALMDGLEWNVRLSNVATPNLIEQFAGTFDSYWEAHMDLLETPPSLNLNDRTWVIHTRACSMAA